MCIFLLIHLIFFSSFFSQLCCAAIRFFSTKKKAFNLTLMFKVMCYVLYVIYLKKLKIEEQCLKTVVSKQQKKCFLFCYFFFLNSLRSLAHIYSWYLYILYYIILNVYLLTVVYLYVVCIYQKKLFLYFYFPHDITTCCVLLLVFKSRLNQFNFSKRGLKLFFINFLTL